MSSRPGAQLPMPLDNSLRLTANKIQVKDSSGLYNAIAADRSTITLGVFDDVNHTNDGYKLRVPVINAGSVVVSEIKTVLADSLDVKGANSSRLVLNADGLANYTIGRGLAFGVGVTDSAELARQGDIMAEKLRAMGEERSLQANISAEAAAREAKDVLQDAALTAEAVARGAADVILQTNISAEAAVREGADADLLQYINKFYDAEHTATAEAFRVVNLVAKDVDISGSLSASRLAVNMVEADSIVGSYIAQYSDMRLKKDVAEVSGASELVNALHPVFYNWNEKATMNPKHKELGFLAQEVEAVLPSIVLTANDEMQTKMVAYDRLVALLVAAVKEHDARIKALERK